MKKGPSLTRIIVLAAFSAGLVIYLLGLVVGFFQASTVYILCWYTSNSYTLIPVFQFEVYPTLVLIDAFLPLSFEMLSPLTLAFLVFAVSAVISAYLKKLGAAVLLSTSALLTAVTQFIVLTPLVGSEPTGLVVMFFLAFPTLYPLPLMVLLSSKNLYPIILSVFFFGAGMLALFAMYVQEKAVLVSSTPISVEHFNALKSIFTRLRILIAPLYVFLFLGFFQVQLLLTEFQNYPLLVFHLMVFSITIGPSDFFWPLWLLFFSLYFIQWRTYSRKRDRLAEVCVSLLVEKLDKQKPVISLLEVEEKLGLESVDKRYFKEVLERARQVGEKEGTIYFGVAGNQLYLKDKLSLIVREKISNLGKADISEIASEIQVDPKLLRTIYSRLRTQKLLENVRISKNMITPSRTAGSP